MRIVHAVRSDNFAGVERHITVLARSQAQAGHNVAVVGGDQSRMRAELDHVGASTYPARTTVAVARTLTRLGNADVLHLHMTAAELAAVFTYPLVRSPIVTTRHFAGMRGSTLPAKWLAQFIQSRVRRQISVSQFVAQKVEGASTVVYAGVAESPVPHAAQRRPEILVAQRLDREKRTHLAVEAFARSGLAQSGWNMVVAGRGPEFDELRHTAHKFGIAGAVTFPGFVDDIDVRMRHAGILLATAPEEPFGLSVVEAMAAGLPVVAARGGGHLETVGRAEDPALFDPCDVHQAAWLLRLLAQDRGRRHSYGQQLLRVQREWFAPARQYRETMSVYDEAMQ